MPRTYREPHIVATLYQGKMIPYKLAKQPERANFVICCPAGDWSGFRTLAECEAQYAELERYHAANPKRDYWVEER